MKAWHQVQPSKQMGGRLSRAWARFPWGSKQQGSLFNRLKTQGFFNLRLTPTQEEFCSDEDHDWSPTVYFDCEDEDDADADDDDNDESLLYGQQLRSDRRDRVYDESSPALENRRPVFYRGLFG